LQAMNKAPNNNYSKPLANKKTVLAWAKSI